MFSFPMKLVIDVLIWRVSPADPGGQHNLFWPHAAVITIYSETRNCVINLLERPTNGPLLVSELTLFPLDGNFLEILFIHLYYILAISEFSHNLLFFSSAERIFIIMFYLYYFCYSELTIEISSTLV